VGERENTRESVEWRKNKSKVRKLRKLRDDVTGGVHESCVKVRWVEVELEEA
jgi:hypothetical protein